MRVYECRNFKITKRKENGEETGFSLRHEYQWLLRTIIIIITAIITIIVSS